MRSAQEKAQADLQIWTSSVSVFGRALSYSVDNRPYWYMRSSTLLEGRAVVQSLLWIIDSVGVEDQRANDIIREYLRVNYGPGTPTTTSSCSISLLRGSEIRISKPMLSARSTVIVRGILHNVDNAVWFASRLASIRPVKVYAPKICSHGSSSGSRHFEKDPIPEGPPYAVLEAAETSEDARASGLIPTMEALGSSLFVLEETQKRLGKIWQRQMSAHFSTVFSVLSAELQRRQAEGLRFGSESAGRWQLAEYPK